MKIKLKKLKISHFKGIKSLDVAFGDVTDIKGDNATGKTTVMDAFLWLLFGKDSTDRKEFEIKHISPNGNTTKDAEVEGTLEVGGRDLLLKRVYKEKWTKRRGRAEAELTGHETSCWVDGVPVTLTEFNSRIGQICSEETFRVLTNPYYFPSLNWKVQRNILFEVAGGETPDEDIAKGNKDFEELLDTLSGRSIEDHRKVIANTKKRIRDDISAIPARIDEVHRNTPEEQDWKAIEKDLTKVQKELEGVEKQIESGAKAMDKQYKERDELQKRLFEAQGKLNEIASQREEQYRRIHNERKELSDRLNALDVELSEKIKKPNEEADKQLTELKASMDKLRQEYYDEQARQFTFDPSLGICPTCKRPLEVDDIEKEEERMRASFNNTKAETLSKIQERGHRLKTQKEEILDLMRSREERQKDIEEEKDMILQKLEQEPETIEIPGHKEASALVEELQKKIDTPIEAPGADQLKAEKQELLSKVDELKNSLSKKEHIANSNKRIKELEDQQKDFASQLTELEKQEFIIQEFERAKVESIEKKVNSMFELVQWRLFETQINGQEVPTCIATYKGVPYPDVNAGGKANIGLDIINVLSEFYQTYAPIFFDNREGVNHLIDTQSQLINLIVTKDKELQIV